MQQTRDSSIHPRRGERGAALIVALVAVVALLGIGMVTMLTVRSDTEASGSDRFQQIALYAAESGAAAGTDFLRNNCQTDGSFYTQFLGESPSLITGNGVQPGEEGNPFTASPKTWFQVTVENNAEEVDPAVDTDGIVVLRSVGYGPNQTQVTLELSLQSPVCVTTFCATDFAQKNMSALNDAHTALCASASLSSAGWTTTSLGGL